MAFVDSNVDKNYCLILAGGRGQRLWPCSRERSPKQFIDFFGIGRTQVQQTWDRMTKVIAPDHVYISTTAQYLDLLREQLPQVAQDHILVEPIPRNTAPSMAWANHRVSETDDDAVMIVVPSDQLILNEDAFQKDVADAMAFAATHDKFLAMGVKPTRPEPGYGYIQKWKGDEETGNPLDQLDALNYHTAKLWKELNSKVKLVSNDDDYKKIPLYLQHKRALITIILKADEGVSRKALAYNVAENDLSAKIYSHATGALEIVPLAGEEFIDYDEDKNGAAESHVSTTRYDAIVEPYDYSENASTDLITKISLSGQHYSFYAENDADFSNNKDSYKLDAGKHLTITVILYPLGVYVNVTRSSCQRDRLFDRNSEAA